MLTLENLREYGADVDTGLSRCMNNEAFYLRMVNMAVDHEVFEKLDAAVDRGAVREIFEAAHALKGMVGNLSLTPLYEPASEMTELARAGKDADYLAYRDGIRLQREKLLALRDAS